MKELTKMTNTEKARLLHDLFPEEMPHLLEYMLTICADLKENEESHRQNWTSGIMTFNLWLRLSEQAAMLIKKFRRDMEKSSRIFSYQLCFGYTAVYLNDQIIKYAAQEIQHPKFKLAINLLYH